MAKYPRAPHAIYTFTIEPRHIYQHDVLSSAQERDCSLVIGDLWCGEVSWIDDG
jgi:hypothetical protein